MPTAVIFDRYVCAGKILLPHRSSENFILAVREQLSPLHRAPGAVTLKPALCTSPSGAIKPEEGRVRNSWGPDLRLWQAVSIQRRRH